MLKELVQFTQTVVGDPIFRNLNLTPKEGLHIVLRVESTPEQISIADDLAFAGVFSKKTTVEGWFEKCAAWSQVAWMVDTNKCFDTPVKAIHSASPFCFALKRTNLEGGDQYLTNQAEKKSQVYDRIDGYFAKAVALLENDEEKRIAEAFRVALSDRDRLHRWLAKVEAYPSVKDGEYVIFYLDLPLETYAAANRKYLKEKLFNTSEYNLADSKSPDLLHGTSNWFNGFPLKKPFLLHQSATFDIAGRISSEEAQTLYDFSDLSRRKLFPNPLPLFIMADEREQAFKIFKDDAVSGGEQRKAYLEIIRELWRDMRKAKPDHELGNYYLLFMVGGEIRDFDFVSRFEFELKDKKGQSWEILNLFKIKEKESKSEVRYPPLSNVSDLQTHVFWKVLANKYRKWDGYFNDIEGKNFENLHNTLLAFRKYRKPIYDFIYKSMRQSINGQIFKEIMLAGISDDLKQGRMFSLMDKLNIWFSLNHHFDPSNINFKKFFMPTKFEELLAKTQSIADSKEQILVDDEVEFSFVAGQMIDYLLGQTEAQTPTHMMLEPFVQKGTPKLLVQEIEKSFQRYWHKLSRQGRGRFEKLMCALQAYNLQAESTKKQIDMKDMKSFVLAGYFAPSVFYEKKQKNDNEL